MVLAQDGTAIMPAVQDAIAQGVPVIAYDRLIEDPGALYITFDNVEVGEMQAQALFDVQPTGNWVIIKGNSADANADFLRGGAEKVIGEAVTAGDITIVGENYTDNWDPANAQTKMEQFLTAANNDIQAALVRERRHGRWRHRGARSPGPRRRGAGVRPGRRSGRPQPGRARHADRGRLEGRPRARHGCR